MVLDAVTTATSFIDVFIEVYLLAILLYVLTSWIRLPYSLRPVQRFLDDVCNPYLRLWRRVIPMAGPLDLSPIAAIFGLVVLREVVNAVLDRLN
jgi:YggT family protein